jgi:hypothetical protein
MLVTLVVQLALPLGMLLWVGLGRHASHASWLLALLILGSLIVLLHVAGLWLVLPWYLPATYGLLGLAASTFSWRRVRHCPRWPDSVAARVGAVLRAVVATVGVAAAVYAGVGRRAPADTTDLVFPLHQGTYLVANGGRTELLNAHLMTLEGERFRAYRGQSYGVDIVRIDRMGRRARGLQPSAPAEYTIFGDSVFAPCAGRVVQATDALPDQPVPVVDRAHMAGNHVLLQCGAAWVLLGHLQLGSVRVARGELVLAGAQIGRVGNTGNTGNTSEPHLHVHAQRPGTASMPLGGDPLSIRFGGRYLARNDRVTSAQ